MTQKTFQECTLDRLKKRSDFLRLQTSEKKWISKSMILQCAPSDVGGTMRVGFTVTKKQFPRAVDRNRVKRRLRAAAKAVFLTSGKPGHDYVLIGRKDALDKEFTLLTGDLSWCLKKIHADDAD